MSWVRPLLLEGQHKGSIAVFFKYCDYILRFIQRIGNLKARTPSSKIALLYSDPRPGSQ